MAAPGPIVYYMTDIINQPVQLVDRYNTTFVVSLSDINYYVNYGVVSSIIFASQIGACFSILVILVMLTKVEKRKSPVFILNSCALFFNTIGALMSCLYYTGPWYNTYIYLSGDYYAVPEYAKSISIAPGAFSCLVTIAIEASLVLQLKVVCVTLTRLQRLLVTCASVFVALTAIAFRIAEVAVTARCNVHAARCDQYVWLYKAQPITTTISICFFSIAFCGKLGWSLFQRRRMGLTQFGPMQIIFIGGFQTLIVPAIFAIIQYATNVPEIASNILTVTAISLPLSSLWASGSISKPSAGARGPDAHRKFIVDSSTTSGGVSRNKSIGEAYGASGGPAANVGRNGVVSEKGKIGMLSSVGSDSLDTPRQAIFPGEGSVDRDLEMQELDGKRY